MGEFFFLVPVIIAVTVLAAAVFIIGRMRKGGGSGGKAASKEKQLTIKDANRRLSVNPKDTKALMVLADAYYAEQSWEKAMKTYNILQDLCATNKDLDEFYINQRFGIAALQMKNYSPAYKSLLFARSLRDDVFEVNYNLGFLEYLRKNFEKAISYLKQAQNSKPEHQQSLKYLGLSYAHLNRNQDAAPLLKKALDIDPSDKETLFILGQVYHNLGQNDQALKVFTHLRADPVFGPKAAIYAGSINTNLRKYDDAILDYEIGLKHEVIPPEIHLELKYRLAQTYLKKQDIGPALRQLKELNSAAAGYRDVDMLIAKYSELHSNRNLQVFLMGETSEFVALCRQMTGLLFPKAKIKITNITVQKNEHADILTEVSTNKWEDVILFRFIRTTGVVGELILRDLYTKIKEVRAGRGFCLTAGTFSDGAKQFVEARLIDLIEKDQITRYLEKLG